MKPLSAGIQFKAARKETGYTQTQIGKMARISQQNISRIETGKRFKRSEICRLMLEYAYLGIGFRDDGKTIERIIPLERPRKKPARPVRFNLRPGYCAVTR